MLKKYIIFLTFYSSFASNFIFLFMFQIQSKNNFQNVVQSIDNPIPTLTYPVQKIQKNVDTNMYIRIHGGGGVKLTLPVLHSHSRL